MAALTGFHGGVLGRYSDLLHSPIKTNQEREKSIWNSAFSKLKINKFTVSRLIMFSPTNKKLPKVCTLPNLENSTNVRTQCVRLLPICTFFCKTCFDEISGSGLKRFGGTYMHQFNFVNVLVRILLLLPFPISLKWSKTSFQIICIFVDVMVSPLGSSAQ